MNNLYTIILSVFISTSTLNGQNISGVIGHFKLDTTQLYDVRNLAEDLEYNKQEYEGDMKRYLQFNYPSISQLSLKEISYILKALKPLHYRHENKFKTEKNFFIKTSEEHYQFRSEAMDFWIKKAGVDKNDTIVQNLKDFNSLLIADLYFSKVSDTSPQNKEYFDAEEVDALLFKHITREDYIDYLNFIILNSDRHLFKNLIP